MTLIGNLWSAWPRRQARKPRRRPVGLAVERLEDRCLLSAYAVTDLGTLGGRSSTAEALNNLGQIVGYADAVVDGRPETHAFLWDQGVMTDLGPQVPRTSSYATGINDAGQVVGYVFSFGREPSYAALWQDGQLTNLGTLPGYNISAADAISNAGQVIGHASAGPAVRAFLYQDGNLGDLGVEPDGNSRGSAINDFGQVVGQRSSPAGSLPRAFLYSDGQTIDLGTLGGEQSAARGVNDLGQVVGWARPVFYSHAFLWQDGAMTDLGVPDGFDESSAAAINNNGQAVGYAYSFGLAADHAFIWQDGAAADLNDLIPPDSGWQLQFAYGINDNGQIVGYGVNPDGETRGFLLTPDSSPGTRAFAARDAAFAPLAVALHETSVQSLPPARQDVKTGPTQSVGSPARFAASDTGLATPRSLLGGFALHRTSERPDGAPVGLFQLGQAVRYQDSLPI